MAFLYCLHFINLLKYDVCNISYKYCINCNTSLGILIWYVNILTSWFWIFTTWFWISHTKSKKIQSKIKNQLSVANSRESSGPSLSLDLILYFQVHCYVHVLLWELFKKIRACVDVFFHMWTVSSTGNMSIFM